jgi:subtilisin family serine protease
VRAAVTAKGGFVPGRLLVAFVPGANGAAIAAAHGVSPVRELLLPGIWIMSVPTGRELEIASALARNPGVRFAEPDQIRVFDDILCTHCQIPDDDFFDFKWDLHNDGIVSIAPGFLDMPTGKVDADIDWLEAHEQLRTTTVGSARIGIVDTGVRATHLDFCGKVIPGHDFVNNDTDASDDHGHGTHVAGIAAACANNSEGVAGVAFPPAIQIVAAKVCSPDGECASSAIIDGIKWVVDQGAHVVSMSFGGTTASSGELDALQYALANGALPVCAAGNEGNTTVIYPAAFPECLAVSATNYGDGLASYSSFGAAVDVAAPGGDLEDFFFGSSFIWSTYNGDDFDYNALVGTSMAAPQVSGLAALLHALQPTATPAQIRARIEQTVDDLGTPGKDNQFGYGRINVYRAINGFTTPGPSNTPPTASFTAQCSGLSCNFNGSASSDVDGTIVSHAWEFGDGGTGSGVTASHVYSTGGTYNVKLTATDDGGATGISIQSITLSSITLSATGYKVKGKKRVDLTWSGATAGNVDVFRNDAKVMTTANDGFHTDNIDGKAGGTFRYKICNAGTTNCSNEVAVRF